MANLKDIKLFLLDMDGTIYLGNSLIKGAKEFLQKITLEGKKFIFLTNNSSKGKKQYKKKLNELGIQVEENNIFTSGEATIIYLKNLNKGNRIYLLGTKDLEEQFEEAGFELIKDRDQQIDFVVLGFDTSLTYEKIWTACEYIDAGIPFIATHPDFNCPLDNEKFMPDTGSMIRMFEASTGRTPIIIGKPEKTIVEIMLNKYGYKNTEVAMVGDRLYTDIKMGVKSGITSILVLSGETKECDYRNSDICADYVFNSVDELKNFI